MSAYRGKVLKKVSPTLSIWNSQVRNLSAWLFTILANLEGEKMLKRAMETTMAITRMSDAKEISPIFSAFFIYCLVKV
jgi:hypothetical protein